MTAAPGTGFPRGSRTRPTTNIRPGAGVGPASSAFAAVDGGPAGGPLGSSLRAGSAEPAARHSNVRAIDRDSRLDMARSTYSGRATAGAGPGPKASQGSTRLSSSRRTRPATPESIIWLLCGEPPDRNAHPRSPARFNRTWSFSLQMTPAGRRLHTSPKRQRVGRWSPR